MPDMDDADDIGFSIPPPRTGPIHDPAPPPATPAPAPTSTPPTPATGNVASSPSAPAAGPVPAATPVATPKVSVGPRRITEVTPDRAFIYAILQGGVAAYYKARDLGIRPEHVQDSDRRVYESFEVFARKGRLPTPLEIKASAAVELEVPAEPFDIDLFAKTIQNRALFNALRAGLSPLAKSKLLDDPQGARDDLAELVRKTAWAIGGVASFNDPSVARGVLDAYEKAKACKGGLLGLSSPWPNVDNHSLGLQPGELTVLLAKRKLGKSFILFSWWLHILRHDLKAGENILLVSMEMPESLIWRRLAAIDLKLHYAKFRAGALDPPDEKRLTDWVEERMTPDPTRPTIHVAGPNKVRDVADVVAKTSETQPKAVGIDGIYILGRDAKLSMFERTLKSITEAKLDLASGQNVPVVATTQLKGSLAKGSLKADADDAAYAKAIGDYADAMRGIHADEEIDAKSQRVFTGMESREFKPVDLLINFDLTRMDFSEIRVVTGPDDDGAKPPPTAPVKRGDPPPGFGPPPTSDVIMPRAPAELLDDPPF